MTPDAFKTLIRKHVEGRLPDLKVYWPNVQRADEPGVQEEHAQGYFRDVGGGAVTYGVGARREAYTYLLFVSCRCPEGTAESAADSLAWAVVRGFDSNNTPRGVRVANKRPRVDGLIDGMYQVTAVVELTFDYSENE